MWLPFVTAALGAFFGSVGGFTSSLYLARRADRQSTTNHLMTEFLSVTFLAHRIALEHLRARMSDGDVTAAQVAGGFWYPGDRNYYRGELEGELNTHQHLTMYIGFLVRMADAIQRRRIDVDAIRAGIGAQLRWCDALVLEVAAQTQQQATENDAPFPTWVAAARLVHEKLVEQLPD
ncbi:hypothetical protein AB0C24_03860 [Amycolatopsis japonica]|uniref:hypothetical protein n=1 Tax=Amycolatopsis japonica TaxID=208439 RepID=UPI0033D82205